ncbi:DUF427 domain-containing protein [Dyella sp. C9]|uniref:DUF427 domain-containing protein n=1 Tax=Dyella sp. C9 TaxID=2202154 RepID=UPI000DEEA9B3|nr:DUF427 domain-containing protein [Dyella sp. C9]
MSDPVRRMPGPDHPIALEPSPLHIVVKVAGKVVADSHASLELREASYPPVYYIPRSDVDMSLLERSNHHTYCPYKGDCAYFSIPLAGDRGINAVWTYEAPYEAVAPIKDHLAFYTTRVDSFSIMTD